MTTNIQLENFAKKHKFKNFRGVIFKDEFKTLGIPLNKECGIYGSKNSSENNMHWACWFKNGDRAYCFDSFGLEPTQQVVKYLKQNIVIKTYSTFLIQQFNEDICGEYCLYVLSELNKNRDFVEVVLNLIKKYILNTMDDKREKLKYS